MKFRQFLPIVLAVLLASACRDANRSSSTQSSQAIGFVPYSTAQLAPPSTGGIVALDFLLQRLGESRRVLVIGAHPDDEDTALLTLAARGYGAEAAYLSLCRGEGGQNLVGEELGVGLGLLRTGELLSARSVDGATQFFTRAYDFGFSKSLEETSRFWQPDSILKDVVRVVRRFRPHVMVTIFTGTARDGHGQHQAAGVVARAAFEVSGDPTRFPELLAEENLHPWTPLKLYQSAWFGQAPPTLELSTGGIDPRSGRTYQQTAMESRSRHRSQDMGRLQPIGPSATQLHLLRDRTGTVGDNGVGDDLFLGVPADTGWLRAFADSLRVEVSASRMESAVEPLARAIIRADRDPINPGASSLLAEALAIAAGVVIDARAESAELVPGEPVPVTVGIYNGGAHDISVQKIEMLVPAGWRTTPSGGNTAVVGAGSLSERRYAVTPATSATLTQPYYLERAFDGGMYDWGGQFAELRGLPLQPPLLRVSVGLRIRGASCVIEREVTYRENDQAFGERRLPIRVVPAVDVKVEPTRLIWPAGDSGERVFNVTIVNNSGRAIAGVVRLDAEELLLPEPVRFRLEQRGESRVVSISVAKRATVERSHLLVRAVALTEDGRVFDRGVVTVSYPHVRPTSMVVAATSDVRIEPVVLPTADRIAYVRGAADRVPEALVQYGLPIELLDSEDLAQADLSSFDALVVGSRAYEVDTALVNHNNRLLAYVERGGHLVVLYQQYQFAVGHFAPYDIEISRPHDRITDENAAVTLLQPGHRAFNVPNSIGSSDWEGWPQERGLYFAGTWDDTYTALLEMADPGSDPLRGGLLVARYGAGTYVYTGLSFFRAIPEGVVGAYKLLLNLLDLGAGEVQ